MEVEVDLPHAKVEVHLKSILTSPAMRMRCAHLETTETTGDGKGIGGNREGEMIGEGSEAGALIVVIGNVSGTGNCIDDELLARLVLQSLAIWSVERRYQNFRSPGRVRHCALEDGLIRCVSPTTWER